MLVCRQKSRGLRLQPATAVFLERVEGLVALLGVSCCCLSRPDVWGSASKGAESVAVSSSGELDRVSVTDDDSTGGGVLSFGRGFSFQRVTLALVTS